MFILKKGTNNSRRRNETKSGRGSQKSNKIFMVTVMLENKKLNIISEYILQV